MARTPQFTDDAIIAAGERLAAAGQPINKTALRAAVGGGNAARLWEVWEQRHARKADPAPATRQTRRKDPEGTRRDVLEVAMAEFAEKGLSGARVDAIAARTRTTKRSIYYHFGSKQGLYIAVMESVYGAIRTVEQAMDFRALEPVAALCTLIEFTFNYHNDHPMFSRLVMIENIHYAKHLKKSNSIRNLNVSVIDDIRDILARGRQEGKFLRDVDPVDIHMMISAFCFFRMSNRHTFSAIFGLDLHSPATMRKHKEMLCDMILSLLMRPDGTAAGETLRAIAAGRGPA